jgi:hypothetical protein
MSEAHYLIKDSASARRTPATRVAARPAPQTEGRPWARTMASQVAASWAGVLEMAQRNSSSAPRILATARHNPRTEHVEAKEACPPADVPRLGDDPGPDDARTL